MATNQYDAIVVGARCAGSPTAMLLARKGYKVLVVDRATFPSDTISTHLIHPPGVAALRALGPARPARGDRAARRSTRMRSTSARSRSPGPRDRRRACRVRPAADRAGQAARGRRVRGGSRGPGRLHRRGGRHRGRARHRRPRPRQGRRDRHRARPGGHRRGRPPLAGREGRAARAVQREAAASGELLHATGAACPWTAASRSTSARDRAFAAVAHARRPHAGHRRLADRGVRGEQQGHRRQLPQDVRRWCRPSPTASGAATREARFVGAAVPNYFRKPFGPGWALVGDAGYNKDFITAQGIQDAFRDAELCATALDETFSGARPFDVAMGELPGHARRARPADVRVHLPARDARAPAARAAAAAGGDARQSGGDGRVRAESTPA